MIETTRSVYNFAMAVPLNKENSRALFLLSVMTARRIGELGKLDYSDINFDTRKIRPRPETGALEILCQSSRISTTPGKDYIFIQDEDVAFSASL